jgi:hypothetical protein
VADILRRPGQRSMYPQGQGRADRRAHAQASASG